MSKNSCKGPVHTVIPEGDEYPRKMCMECGYIAYENPKVVCGAICTWEGKILICKRAIEPKKGFWTIPAGFLELNESTAQGAIREVREEACADIKVTGLIGIYEIPRISQIYVIHKAEMTGPKYSAGLESEDVMLSSYSDIPWQHLAFSSIHWGLEQFKKNSGPSFHIHNS